ncbi:hypothetical protein HLB42_16945 (plasmid) [Deinococcus sp. D7000]|nr:hypothetical protein HLB42_16945 [Deinococcus sp. D7000]
MKRTATKGLFLGASLGLGALAADTLTTFQAGTPIRAAEVNANFGALKAGLDGKQHTLSGSPCQTGQFVKGIGADGALSCAPDQIGAGGAAGVASLNGKTGSLALEAGSNIKIDSSQAGKLILSATGSPGGGGTLTLPYSGAANGTSPAFSVSNSAGMALSGSSTDGNAVYAISGKGYGVSAYSEASFGVVGFTNSGLAGVYGESKVSGAAGVRGVNSVGPGSSGMWGESAPGSGVRGSSVTGTGVLGISERGYGVRGTVSASGTGVYGENTSGAAGAGVQGRADAVNSVGVGGLSAAGTGVQGTSASGTGVQGASGNGTGVRGTSGSGGTGVEGSVTGTNGSGVRGTHASNGFGVYGNSPGGVGVGGESTNSVGVQGKGPVAMKAVGNAVQSPGFGGWAKGMVIVDVTRPAGQQIVRCYNSQLSGAAMNTVPCGYSLESAKGQWRVIFGFDTRSTFAAATLTDNQGSCFVSSCDFPAISGVLYENDSVVVVTRNSRDYYYANPDKGFTLILY